MSAPSNQSPDSTSAARPLYRRLAHLGWPIAVIVVGAAAIQQGLLFLLLRILPPAQHSLAQLALYGIAGLLLAYVGLRWLARTLARQERAELAVQQAYAELEHTHHKLQVIHDVGRQVANASDVQELLGIAARVPVEVLGARGSSVITFDRKTARADLEMTWGLQNSAVLALRQRVHEGNAASICAGCQPLTARINQSCPLLYAVQDSGYGPSLDRIVCLPLGRDQERMGMISAYLDQDVKPSAEETQLATILATEITAALEGVQMRAGQMATLYAVDRATQERSNLDSLLSRVLSSTVRGWNAQVGAILLLEGDSGTWSVRAHQGLGNDLGAAGFGLALRLAEQARASKQAVVLREQAGDETPPSLAILLLQAEGQVLGALFLGSSQPGAFKSSQGELMSAVASQIALAVRNVQLYAQLRQTAVLEERYRLSREMHDGLAQTLGYLSMQAERLEALLAQGDQPRVEAELAELRRVIGEAFQDVREAIDGLRIGVEQPGGFSGALRSHAEDFTRRTGLPVDCQIGEEPEDLAPEAALHLLRITQEALANIRRHAQASHVWVHLARENGHLELTVADDGLGFDPALSQERHHVGLASMRERIRSLDGQLTVATGPGHGTRVTARVPL